MTVFSSFCCATDLADGTVPPFAMPDVFTDAPNSWDTSTDALLSAAAATMQEVSGKDVKKPKKPNVKRFGGEKFAFSCPNDECVMGTAAIERLGGCGQSREGYHCSTEQGGCGNRWSQRTYINDEVTAEAGTDDPCIRRCTKRSHLEKKYGVHPQFKFKTRSSHVMLCTRTIGCTKLNKHRGACNRSGPSARAAANIVTNASTAATLVSDTNTPMINVMAVPSVPTDTADTAGTVIDTDADSNAADISMWFN